MQILVFADSHGDVDTMESVLRDAGADAVIHLGDYIRDGRELRRRFSGTPFYLVAGNMDGRDESHAEALLTLSGRRVFIAHGHFYGVKRGYAEIRQRGRSQGADIVLFGHTHNAYAEREDGMWLMNPGSSRGIGATYGVVEIGGDEARCEIKSAQTE